MSERCEDPLYVLENGLPIDVSYYLTNRFSRNSSYNVSYRRSNRFEIRII